MNSRLPSPRDADVVSISDRTRYMVPGLERGLALLQLFDRRARLLSASEITQALAIPRTTVFRLLQTLELLGFIERIGKQFRLGPAVLRLGFEYLAAVDLPEVARPILEQMRDATGHSTQLAIRDGTDVVVVAKAAAPSAFASSVHVGTRMPAHATVLGRVLLAGLADRDLERMYADTLTPRAFANLRSAVVAAVKDRCAVSESGFEAGISAIAAPVHDSSGHAVAAISLVATLPRFESTAERERLVSHVLEAAAALSHRLNYRPPSP